ncbi:hypothetical protein HPB47_007609, partial [Ixodes persulcatus]
ALRWAFEPYGEVKGVTREKWRIEGLADVDSTTVIVRIVLREDLTLESLPHQLRLYGGTLLVVVPGRAPVCLRCRRTGHIRRDCRVPMCEDTRAFGHEASDCVRPYARAAASKTINCQDGNLVMNEGEAEAAATPTVKIASQDPQASVQTTPTTKNAIDALDAGDETAMDFAAEAVKRRLSDLEEVTDQSLQQTESPCESERTPQIVAGDGASGQLSDQKGLLTLAGMKMEAGWEILPKIGQCLDPKEPAKWKGEGSALEHSWAQTR